MNAISPFEYIMTRANIPDSVVTQKPVAGLLRNVRSTLMKQGALACVSGVFLFSGLNPMAMTHQSPSGPLLPSGVRDMGTASNIEQVHEERVDMEVVFSRRPDVNPQMLQGYNKAADAYSQALQSGKSDQITAAQEGYSASCQQIMNRSGLENTYIALKTERITDQAAADLRVQNDLKTLSTAQSSNDDMDM